MDAGTEKRAGLDNIAASTSKAVDEPASTPSATPVVPMMVEQTKLTPKNPPGVGPRPHRCDVCQRSFREVATLRKHEQLHRADRPYVCLTCGKSFLWSSNLKVHERVHTGERPYKCKICHRCFTQSNDLRRHERNVHMRGKIYGYKNTGGRQSSQVNLAAYQAFAMQQRALLQQALSYESYLQKSGQVAAAAQLFHHSQGLAAAAGVGSPRLVGPGGGARPVDGAQGQGQGQGQGQQQQQQPTGAGASPRSPLKLEQENFDLPLSRASGLTPFNNFRPMQRPLESLQAISLAQQRPMGAPGAPPDNHLLHAQLRHPQELLHLQIANTTIGVGGIGGGGGDHINSIITTNGLHGTNSSTTSSSSSTNNSNHHQQLHHTANNNNSNNISPGGNSSGTRSNHSPRSPHPMSPYSSHHEREDSRERMVYVDGHPIKEEEDADDYHQRRRPSTSEGLVRERANSADYAYNTGHSMLHSQGNPHGGGNGSSGGGSGSSSSSSFYPGKLSRSAPLPLGPMSDGGEPLLLLNKRHSHPHPHSHSHLTLGGGAGAQPPLHGFHHLAGADASSQQSHLHQALLMASKIPSTTTSSSSSSSSSNNHHHHHHNHHSHLLHHHDTTTNNTLTTSSSSTTAYPCDSVMDLSINKTGAPPPSSSPPSRTSSNSSSTAADKEVSLSMPPPKTPHSSSSLGGCNSESESESGGKRDVTTTSATPTADSGGGIHHCHHCNIFFYDFTMFHLHESLHLPYEEDPFRCPSCGTHCQDKIEFMFHTVWHVKYPHTIPNYTPFREGILASP